MEMVNIWNKKKKEIEKIESFCHAALSSLSLFTQKIEDHWKIVFSNVVFVRDYRNISKKRIFSFLRNVEMKMMKTKTNDDDDDDDEISFSDDVFRSMGIDFDL